MDFERLGVFYLGRPVRQDEPEQTGPDYLLLPSKQLTTHAVCVGMTGSGKTGLCIGLLEEAAIDGIPALVIDPKGDMTNLMLSFPEMRAEDFLPWIDADEARQAGLSPQAFASDKAAYWRQGLAQWDQLPERIRTMRQTTAFSVYTPGSSAGLQLSVLDSFDRPDDALLEDAEQLQELASGLAASLLGLIGLEADPLRSREQILIATLLLDAWTAGKDLGIQDLIRLIQEPPMAFVGVLPVDDFFKPQDRMQLALHINNLLASPGFSFWLEGEPLDISRLLYTDEGKPRLSILSLAHLSESERQFFVSLLLHKMVSWTRAQPGTSSLRALVYMDEIFGYFPPTANPPSKAPLLTLLKQARAHGVGVMLTTQNPVDLDYKGLANAGTWFIGRLQTERDKKRMLDGLEGAATFQGQGFRRADLDRHIAGLAQRTFLLYSVHNDDMLLFETRWCLSYLFGPMTREHIKQLEQKPTKASLIRQEQVAQPASAQKADHDFAAEADQAAAASPVLPAGMRPIHAPPRGSLDSLVYKPAVIGVVQIGYSDRSHDLYHTEEKRRVAPITGGIFPVDWDKGLELELDLDAFDSQAHASIPFEPLTEAATDKKNHTTWKKDLADWAYRTCRLTVPYAPDLKQAAQAGEEERDFRIRLQQAAREWRDQELLRLEQKYEPKIKALEEKIRKAEQAVARKKEQASDAKMQTAISVGATVLSAFLGKKAVSATSVGKATTAARGVSRSVKQSGDLSRSQETVSAYEEQLEELHVAFDKEAQALKDQTDPNRLLIENLTVQPFKKDIQAKDLVFAWMPYRKQADGTVSPSW